ncbi:cytochrome c oxidase assembly protein [Actinoplanes sp. NPDC049681]|uniref:cytochrome c oxidase assembly protein n=1 Tax=Actinoplanes sp. NPDC049681 TaxID=3363905 RepID=UPI003796ACC5
MTVLAVVSAALGYEWLGLRARRWNPWRGAAFAAGCATALAGLGMHTHDTAGHMGQHLLVAMIAPLGIVLGAPVTLLLRTLPVSWARRLSRMLRTRPVGFLTRPVVALALSAGSLLLLHLTPLFAYAMSNPAVHSALLVHFLLSGCLFAWVIAGPDPAPHRPGVRTRLIVLAVAIAVHAGLSQLMYAGVLVRTPGTVADRQAAATLMYYGGDLAELLLAFAMFQARVPAPPPGADRSHLRGVITSPEG